MKRRQRHRRRGRWRRRLWPRPPRPGSAGGCAHGRARSTPAGQRRAVRHGRPGDGRSSPGNRLTVQFWLKSQTAAAESYATAVTTPGTALFQHYLSPAAYTARFGASARRGRSNRGSSRRGSPVLGRLGPGLRAGDRPVSTIDAAFTYSCSTTAPPRPTRAVRLRANDRPVSLPARWPARARGHRPGQRRAGGDLARPRLGRARSAGRRADRSPARPTTPSTTPAAAQQYGATAFPTVVCGYTPTSCARPTATTGTTSARA